jgi:hypothetical protein
MPQLQLPIFPAGVTEINSQIAVQKEAGRVFYLHGHLPAFQHQEQDVRSFRMFTSQMIAVGTVKPKEIVQTFGVPMVADAASLVVSRHLHMPARPRRPVHMPGDGMCQISHETSRGHSYKGNSCFLLAIRNRKKATTTARVQSSRQTSLL